MAVGKDYIIGETYVWLEFNNIPTRNADRELIFYISYNGGVTWSIDGSYTIAAGTAEPISVSHYYFGLSPGTSYAFKGELHSTSVNTYGPYYWTTEMSYDDDSAYVTYTTSPTGITVYVTSITPRSYTRTVRFQIGGPSGPMVPITLAAYSTSASYPFTGLSPNTTYDVIIGIRAPDETRTFYWRSNITTADYNHVTMLSANFLWDAEESHFEIWAYVSLANAVSYDTVFKLTLDGGRALIATIPAGQKTPTNPGRGWTSSINANETYTVSLYDTLKEREIASVDITPGFNHTLSFTVDVTATTIKPTVVLTSGATSYDVDLTFFLDYPDMAKGRPLSADIAAGKTECTRSWTSDIEPGSVHTIYLQDNMRVGSDGAYLLWQLTRRNNNAFEWNSKVESNEPFQITAEDWNKFISQLNEKENYFKNNNRTFTSATSGKVFKADMYNQAVNAINNIAGSTKNNQSGGITTMLTKSEGDNVLAADIKQLAACLNE